MTGVALNLNITYITLSLLFLLFIAIFIPDEASSCETVHSSILALHEEGLVAGYNALILCTQYYQVSGAEKYSLDWDWSNMKRPKNEYLQTTLDYLDPTNENLKIERNVLVIPSITKNDNSKYTCIIRKSKCANLTYDLVVHDELYPGINDSTHSVLRQLEKRIPVNEKFKIECIAVGYPKPTITWYKNSIPITEYCFGSQTEADACLSEDNTTVTINKVEERSEGKYNCTVTNPLGTVHASKWIISKQIGVFYENDKQPKILEGSTILKDKEIDPNVSFKYTCYIAGWPVPNVTWFLPTEVENSNLTEEIDQNELVFRSLTTQQLQGNYGCIDQMGKLGNPRYSQLIIHSEDSTPENKDPRNPYTTVIIISIFFIIAFVAIALLLKLAYLRRSKESVFLEEFIKDFHRGCEENFNPDLEIKEQADCIPYNTAFEFPRSHLKLGKRLGSGAFGMVMFGEANGIIRKNLVTPVAVKMVKSNFDISQIKALASELKIMLRIGKHLNIVNLLGACTDDLKNLFVIIEYCSYGNLHDFLLQNREIFVSQVDHDSGIYKVTDVKSTILEEMMTSTYVETDRFHPGKSTESTFDTTYSSQSCDELMKKENCDYDDVDSPPKNFDEEKSNEKSNDPRASDSCLLTDAKSMPKLDSVSNHYEFGLPKMNTKIVEENAEIHMICTDDLFCWAYQIARGMEYLSSRKIVHADLAIRNVLLANHNIVKISDFGLSKNVYHYTDENYVKKSKQALPVKWMALESIGDRIFSTQSDVWTYGIVLWELFSLAETPYAGLDDFEKLYRKLKLGFRMERPPNATTDIYHLMLACWHDQPKERPNFSSISEAVGGMLERTLKDYYIGLVEYIEENPNQICDDYYQFMCYKKSMYVPTAPPIYDTAPPIYDTAPDDDAYDETEGLEMKEIGKKSTSGYLDMQGHS